MYKVYLSNNEVYTSNETQWMNLPNDSITKIEFFLDEETAVVLEGFEQYIVLKEMEAIVGLQKPNMVSMSVLAKHGEKCYQFTQNLIWNKIGQSINDWGKEYTPMGFNWKKQEWVAGAGRPTNHSLWHEGASTGKKPSSKLLKV